MSVPSYRMLQEKFRNSNINLPIPDAHLLLAATTFWPPPYLEVGADFSCA